MQSDTDLEERYVRGNRHLQGKAIPPKPVGPPLMSVRDGIDLSGFLVGGFLFLVMVILAYFLFTI